jgi:hypothetical protein
MIRIKRLVRHSVLGTASILLSTLWVSAVWGAMSAVTTPQASTDTGALLYSQRCAGCHDGPVARAPHKIVFPMLGPEYVLSAMSKKSYLPSTSETELSVGERTPRLAFALRRRLLMRH